MGIEDDEAHVEEHGDGQHQGRGRRAARHTWRGPRHLGEALGQGVGATGDFDHAAQHGAQRHQDGHRPSRAADASNQGGMISPTGMLVARATRG